MPQPNNRPKATNVADLDVGGLDSVGQEVRLFYGRKPPVFAVYRTQERVSVHFADDTNEANRQRKNIAPLNPIRGEINGLLDGWRCRREGDRRYHRVLRFDRRVGDALVVAFEDDVPDAAILLARIKQDILDERTAWARFEYLMAAFGAGLFMIVLTHLFTPAPISPPSSTEPVQVFGVYGASLWAAAAAGAAGAFFSIATGLRGRTVLPDLLWLANTMDAILRIVIGVIGAAVLITLINLQLFKLSFGSAEIGGVGAAPNDWLKVLLVGFVAGFSERLVPDLLSKAATKPAEPPPRRDGGGRIASRPPAARRTRTEPKPEPQTRSRTGPKPARRPRPRPWPRTIRCRASTRSTIAYATSMSALPR